MGKKVERDAKSGKFVDRHKVKAGGGSFITEKRGYTARAPADSVPPSSMTSAGSNPKGGKSK